MGNEQGATATLIAAVVAALRDVPELSQVSDGVPIQAGDAAAIVEAGPETDWGFKGGDGAELRFAVLVTCGGEAPARARALGEAIRGAMGGLAPTLGDWRLISLALVRSRTLRAAGPKWTTMLDYRARMTRD